MISNSSYVLPYKLLFHLHELLVEIESLAKENPLLWQEFLLQNDKTGNGKSDTVSMLINLSKSLGDESITLCLSLAAMAFSAGPKKNDHEKPSENTEMINTCHIDKTLVKVILKDLDRLIDIYLIGTNRKGIRSATVLLIKGIYETNIVSE